MSVRVEVMAGLIDGVPARPLHRSTKSRVEQVEEWSSMKLCMHRGVVSTRECLSFLGR